MYYCINITVADTVPCITQHYCSRYSTMHNYISVAYTVTFLSHNYISVS